MSADSEHPNPDGIDAISALGEPSRRALYDHIVSDGGWVSRDQAAEAVGLERGTAAHHLDRLAADGLLDVDYQRLTGREGPGAGRPAKLYRRTRHQIGVSLPPRDYELAGQMLAAAADRARSEGTPITTALDEEAASQGRRLAETIQSRLRGTKARRASTRRHAVVDVLEEHGFEPITANDGSIVLRNCPFHQLAQEHTELVCGMNLCMLTTVVDEVGRTGLSAHLEPEEGLCCVKFHAR